MCDALPQKQVALGLRRSFVDVIAATTNVRASRLDRRTVAL
jgi:hypothetical protein